MSDDFLPPQAKPSQQKCSGCGAIFIGQPGWKCRDCNLKMLQRRQIKHNFLPLPPELIGSIKQRSWAEKIRAQVERAVKDRLRALEAFSKKNKKWEQDSLAVGDELQRLWANASRVRSARFWIANKDNLFGDLFVRACRK